MTCIVGIARNGHVWIGGDTAASDKVSHVSVTHPKVFIKDVPVEDGTIEQMIIGCAGSFRVMQVVEHTFVPPLIRKNQRVMAYLTNDFTDALMTTFQLKGLSQRGKTTESFDGEFLIGIRGQLFLMDSSYQLISVPEQEFAAGTGADFAFGSLFSTRLTNWSPKTRIIEALECASEFNLQTKPPFDIVKI